MPDDIADHSGDITYTAAQVKEMLGVGGAMLRRYAASYEKLTRSEIELHRRDGRLFTQEQLGILQATRDRVQRTGVSVDIAMAAVLSRGDAAVELPARALPVDTQALVQALAEAYSTANAPLLTELRGVRSDLEALRDENRALRDELRGRALPEAEDVGKLAQTQHAIHNSEGGLLVRAARRLERMLGR